MTLHLVEIRSSNSWQQPVEDKDLNSAPTGPAKGDRYIVGPSPTGAWAEHAEDITYYDGSDWQFITKAEGQTVYVKDEDKIYTYLSSWEIPSGPTGPTGPTGPSGPTGATGPTGPTGTCTYASITEVNAATEAAKAVSPDGLGGSIYGEKGVCIAQVESDTDVAVADGKIAFTVPLSLDGMNLVDVIASVHTKGVTGTTDIQIRRRRAGVEADMLSTKITIGDEFFASDEVIDGNNDDVEDGDQIYIDVDAVHSGTVPKGLSVVLTFRLP